MSKTKPKPVETEPTRIEFETFRKIGEYETSSLIQKEPSCFNSMVNARRYRITVELIEEPKETVFKRIRKMWRECDNMHKISSLRDAAKELGFELHSSELGIDKRKG